MKKFVAIVLLVCLVIIGLSLQAMAEDRVKRAVKNTLLGWTEIPKSITKVTKDTDNPFLGITVGLLKGIANTFSRTTSGIADVVTLPCPSIDEPVIKDTMIDE